MCVLLGDSLHMEMSVYLMVCVYMRGRTSIQRNHVVDDHFLMFNSLHKFCFKNLSFG